MTNHAYQINNGPGSSVTSLTDVDDLGVLKSNFIPGTLWACGYNSWGGLGLGNTTNCSSPTQVGILSNWKNVSDGLWYSTGIQTNGTLWAWGENQFGQLGLGNIANYSSPVQVGLQSNWKNVYACGEGTFSIQTNGTLWAWGENQFGQLGLGDTNNRSSPCQVGALSNWKSVTGYTSILAIKQDGTLWGWGNGGPILSGLSNTSSPAQIGTLSNWQSVSSGQEATFAIQTNGTLWACGSNVFNSLGFGNNSISTYSSLTQLGALSNWQSVSVDISNYSYFALQSNGTLWAWGDNTYGELGLGDTNLRSSPTQIGLLTTWVAICCGTLSNFAIQSNGTLWTWGYNNYGQLGLGDTNNRSSPCQVGSLTNWKSVSSRYYSMLLQSYGNYP